MGYIDVAQKTNGGLTATELAWIQTMLSSTCGKAKGTYCGLTRLLYYFPIGK